MSTAPGIQIPAEQRVDTYWSIVSDLVSLIDRTHGYQRVKEAVETVQSQEDEVVVLDDLRPAQTPEIQLLSDCNLRLREALHFLLEANASRKRSQSVAGNGASTDREHKSFASGNTAA